MCVVHEQNLCWRNWGRFSTLYEGCKYRMEVPKMCSGTRVTITGNKIKILKSNSIIEQASLPNYHLFCVFTSVFMLLTLLVPTNFEWFILYVLYSHNFFKLYDHSFFFKHFYFEIWLKTKKEMPSFYININLICIHYIKCTNVFFFIIGNVRSI